MEILSAFQPSLGGLDAFFKWAASWKDETVEASEVDCPEGEGVTESDVAKLREFKRKHRTVRRNWEFPTNFPSPLVRDAYLRPDVDASTEPCSWERPDLVGLRSFCLDK